MMCIKMNDPFVFGAWSLDGDIFVLPNKPVPPKLITKNYTDEDFELDLDYIIIVKPKVDKVIEYFKEVAKKLNEEYFEDK